MIINQVERPEDILIRAPFNFHLIDRSKFSDDNNDIIYVCQTSPDVIAWLNENKFSIATTIKTKLTDRSYSKNGLYVFPLNDLQKYLKYLKLVDYIRGKNRSRRCTLS